MTVGKEGELHEKIPIYRSCSRYAACRLFSSPHRALLVSRMSLRRTETAEWDALLPAGGIITPGLEEASFWAKLGDRTQYLVRPVLVLVFSSVGGRAR